MVAAAITNTITHSREKNLEEESFGSIPPICSRSREAARAERLRRCLSIIQPVKLHLPAFRWATQAVREIKDGGFCRPDPRQHARQRRAHARRVVPRSRVQSQFYLNCCVGATFSRADARRYIVRKSLTEHSYIVALLPATIRKSSSFLPSFNALVSHRGRAPRPHHVPPSGPRYFGAIFLAFALDAFAAPLVPPP
jgi:hypothetical protein